ncbi:VWA domain-containing protein [Bacteroidota bacterium]
MVFANPEWFYLLIIIPLLIAWYILRHKRQQPELKVSTTEGFEISKPTWKVRFRHIIFVLRIIAFSLIIIVLARPQTTSSRKNIRTEGIDIVMALDISTSMLAEDFKPNRLEAAKRTAVDFIDERIDDRIGLVVFAGESFTQCPVTIDHDVIKNLFKDLKTGMIEDGTAIGMGLATSVNRLKESKAKSKVIILLTDGVNNTGIISPQTAAEIAQSFSIRVYTIGVGTRGFAPYPVQTPWGMRRQNMEVKIDEDLLKQIATLTGGKYFRATNNKALRNIYKEIDKMEKTRVDVSIYSRKTEEFLPFAIVAAFAFLLELLLRFLVFRNIP